MAKMLQDTLVINVSTLLRDTDERSALITPEILTQLDAVLVELIADSRAMIEVTMVDK